MKRDIYKATAGEVKRETETERLAAWQAVYKATAGKVNREMFPVKMSLDRQINEIQIEQTTIPSKRSYTIFEAIPHISHMKYTGIQLEDI